MIKPRQKVIAEVTAALNELDEVEPPAEIEQPAKPHRFGEFVIPKDARIKGLGNFLH